MSISLTEFRLQHRTAQWIRLPDTGKPISWRVRLTVSGAGNLRLAGGRKTSGDKSCRKMM
jgi:hypothetical protein